MKITSKRILTGTAEEGKKCGVVSYARNKDTNNGMYDPDYFIIDESKDAFAYIEYSGFGAGKTAAYVDRDTFEYLIDCAMPAKIQYAREFAELKADFAASKALLKSDLAACKAANKAARPETSNTVELDALKARVAALEAENAALKAAKPAARKAKPEARSSWIEGIDYDAAKLALYVTIGANRYRYDKVTKTLYLSMVRAESQGAFFSKMIKPYYTAARV